ncbi:DUF998 domain-containing protein [Corynebacterium choanae]|uniref:DUF998 domain-containing protein n=1 Tax=Corynebacterium choanae TaxID=1862358 RepID=A0A3G6J897_9CORY|nr:DUF998 domain-containing protein [Corynebacterium choanae]AZA12670.1 hypothetical protein CCHOA_01210 [Corynebacterium choanae]
MLKIVYVLAIAAALAYATWAAGPLVPEVDATNAFASEYASPVWHLSWLFQLGDLLTGILLCALTILAARVHITHDRIITRPLTICRALVVLCGLIFAIATIFDASNPLPCPVETTAPSAINGPLCDTPELHIHEFTSGLIGTVAVIAMLLVALMQHFLIPQAKRRGIPLTSGSPDPSLDRMIQLSRAAGSRRHYRQGFPADRHVTRGTVLAVGFTAAALYCTASVFIHDLPYLGLIQRISLALCSLWWLWCINSWLGFDGFLDGMTRARHTTANSDAKRPTAPVS